MFSKRLDAIMNIAEVSNSLLGRDIHMNPSYIGRLRSGARPLPKKHDYIPSICEYLSRHIVKDYQITALQKLTGISDDMLSSPDTTALHLEDWLLRNDETARSAASQLISLLSSIDTDPVPSYEEDKTIRRTQTEKNYFFGNEGKRNAVEQFFQMILLEKEPQTLLLFSDETMDWLFEDTDFARRWLQLFSQVIAKGNRVKIIHTISRDINEMMEAVSKWLPLYLTGNIESYHYPKLRDGVFQRTLFIAPDTAAISSASINHNTNGMLNLFITDPASIAALTLEYKNLFSICRPLIHVFTEENMHTLNPHFHELSDTDAAACLYALTPPLFTMPADMVQALAKEHDNKMLVKRWEQDVDAFSSMIKSQRLTLILPVPESIADRSGYNCHSCFGELNTPAITYGSSLYAKHIEHVKRLESQHKNLKIVFRSDFRENMTIYAKDETGAVVIKTNKPRMAFLVGRNNITNALWDYLLPSK